LDSATGAAAFLAVIALLDGLRLLPAAAGAIVVRNTWLRGWSVARVSEPDDRERVRLLTWCSPVALPLVLSTRPQLSLPARRLVARFRARRARTRGHVVALRVGGVSTLIALVLGIPLLTSRYGLWGLLVAVSAVLLLSLTQAAVAMRALRRAGSSLREAAVASVRLCWPFTAPRAAEEVERQVASGMPPLVLLAELLPPGEFGSFVRPLLYDAVVRGVESPDVRDLCDHLGESRIRALTREPPMSADGEAWCPRCGDSFARAHGNCSDCADVALVPRFAAETHSLTVA
jgi:hypothetical protein